MEDDAAKAITELLALEQSLQGSDAGARDAAEKLRRETARKLRLGLPAAVRYDDVEPSLQTGDLVFFQGASWTSRLIRIGTGMWSHVAMVVVLPKALEPFMWESVSHADCFDVITNAFKSGVRLVKLRERLKGSESPFFGIARLHPALREKRARLLPHQTLEAEFRDFSASEVHKPYEHSLFTLFRVAFDCGLFGHNEVDTRSYCCSELVCETLQYIHLVERYFDDGTVINSARVSPTDFWEANTRDAQRLEGVALVGARYYIPRLDLLPPSALPHALKEHDCARKKPSRPNHHKQEHTRPSHHHHQHHSNHRQHRRDVQPQPPPPPPPPDPVATQARPITPQLSPLLPPSPSPPRTLQMRWRAPLPVIEYNVPPVVEREQHAQVPQIVVHSASSPPTPRDMDAAEKSDDDEIAKLH